MSSVEVEMQVVDKGWSMKRGGYQFAVSSRQGWNDELGSDI